MFETYVTSFSHVPSSLEEMGRDITPPKCCALWGRLCQRQAPYTECIISIYYFYFSNIKKLYTSTFHPQSGNCEWKAYDLFGGCLCLRQSWWMIQAAAKKLWGLEVGGSFGFNASWCDPCLKQTNFEWIELKQPHAFEPILKRTNFVFNLPHLQFW